MAQKIIRHELVEVVIPQSSTLSRFVIPDLPNLRNVHLFGIEVYDKTILNKGIQTQLNLLPINPVIKDSFITLVNYSGKEFLKQSPSQLYRTIFHQDIGGGGVPPTDTINHFEWNNKSFVGQKVSWPKSYIEFTTPPASVIESLVYVFSVYYSLPIAEEKAESGYSFSRQK
jgi:hypothetical protein